MGRDHLMQTIADWKDGEPVDSYGHFLDKDDIREGEARELTNPYGALHWGLGNGDDFHCFDYNGLDDGRIILHAACNSETGSFIMGAGYEVVAADEAIDIAMGMTDMAVEWLYDGGGEYVEHDADGWNQDEWYFYRCICIAVARQKDKLVCFSDREKRFGGTKINEFCNLRGIPEHPQSWLEKSRHNG
jgi:hypothetical protein